MTEIRRNIVIAASVDTVFQYAADWRNWPTFFEGVSGFNPTTEITRGNGAIYAYKAEMLGMKVSVETAISDFVENVGWTGTAVRGLPHKTQWIFESQNQQTMFTYILNYRVPIPLLGMLLDKLIVKPAWEKIIEHSLQNLKTQTEGISNT